MWTDFTACFYTVVANLALGFIACSNMICSEVIVQTWTTALVKKTKQKKNSVVQLMQF